MKSRRIRARRIRMVKRLFLPRRPINHYRAARGYPPYYAAGNGHETYIDRNRTWRYEACGSLVVPGQTRPCFRCGRIAKRGQDRCIAGLPQAIAACCGHGVEQGYVLLSNRRAFRFGWHKAAGQVREAVALVLHGKPLPPGFVWDAPSRAVTK